MFDSEFEKYHSVILNIKKRVIRMFSGIWCSRSRYFNMQQSRQLVQSKYRAYYARPREEKLCLAKDAVFFEIKTPCICLREGSTPHSHSPAVHSRNLADREPLFKLSLPFQFCNLARRVRSSTCHADSY